MRFILLFSLLFTVGCAVTPQQHRVTHQELQTTTGDLTPASRTIDLAAICQNATIRERLGNRGINTPYGRFFCGTER
jgi:hypothetical protein